MKKEKGITVSVVIVAAGKSSRMDMDLNKQYIKIDGIPVLARTIQAFEDCSLIDEIILVVSESDIIYCKQNIVDYYNFQKVKALVSGGSTRQISVYNGLQQVNQSKEIVLIHDGARPFISADSIMDSISAAEEFGAACIAVPVKDTIKSTNEENFVQKTLDRSTLWSVQTPQAFRYEIIMKAHKNAFETGFNGTDDASLVENMGYPLKLILGSYYNIKITTKEDIILAEAIANMEL